MQLPWAQIPPVAAFTACCDTPHKRLIDERCLGARLTR